MNRHWLCELTIGIVLLSLSGCVFTKSPSILPVNVDTSQWIPYQDAQSGASFNIPEGYTVRVLEGQEDELLSGSVTSLYIYDKLDPAQKGVRIVVTALVVPHPDEGQIERLQSGPVVFLNVSEQSDVTMGNTTGESYIVNNVDGYTGSEGMEELGTGRYTFVDIGQHTISVFSMRTQESIASGVLQTLQF